MKMLRILYVISPLFLILIGNSLARAQDFTTALTETIASSTNDFKALRKESTKEVTEDGDQIFDPLIRLPRAKSARIWYYKDPGNEPAARYNFGRNLKDAAAASAKFDELKQNVTASIPTDWIVKEESDDTGKLFGAYKRGSGPSINLRLRFVKISNTSTIDLVVLAPRGDANAVRLPDNSNLTAAEDAVVLVDEDMDVTWHPTADNHTVDFTLPYRNIANKTVKCTISVVSGHKPRDADTDDFSEWEERYRTNYDIMLAPGETRTISGTLNWYRREDTEPFLRFPNNHYVSKDFIKADFTE